MNKTAAESKLRAFAVFDNDRTQGAIVFAESATDAKGIAFGNEYWDGIEYLDLRAERTKDADKYALQHGRGVLDWEKNVRTYYELGWHGYEENESCVCCGLYQFEEIPESFCEETDEGILCKSCRDQEAAEIAQASAQQAAGQQ